MHRKFIALIIATALAVTGLSAAPARADTDDIAKVLFGLTALALIGKAISDRNDNDTPILSQRNPVRPPLVQPRPLPPQVARYDLPRDCLRNYSLVGGPRRLFGAHCLQRNYRHAASLPGVCQVRFRDRGAIYTGYEPLCLRNRGYRVAGY